MKPTISTTTFACFALAMAACGGSTSTSSSGSDGGTLEDASSGNDASSHDDASSNVDAGSCIDRYAAALEKQCAAATDCVLVNHDDCCGNVVTAIRTGTQASFQAAEQAYLACETGCGARGCAHADMAEDGQSLSSLGPDGGTRTIVARCDTGRCSSHVQ